MTQEGRKPPERAEYLKGLALLAWISSEILALTGSGVILGWALHRWLDWPLILALPFGLAGLFLAIYRIYRVWTRMEGQK